MILDPFDHNGSAFALVELDLDELDPIDYDVRSILQIMFSRNESQTIIN